MRIPLPLLLAAVVVVGSMGTIYVKVLSTSDVAPPPLIYPPQNNFIIPAYGYVTVFVSAYSVTISANTTVYVAVHSLYGGMSIHHIPNMAPDMWHGAYVTDSSFSGNSAYIYTIYNSTENRYYYYNPFVSCSCVNCPTLFPARAVKTNLGVYLFPDPDSMRIIVVSNGFRIYDSSGSTLIATCSWHKVYSGTSISLNLFSGSAYGLRRDGSSYTEYVRGVLIILIYAPNPAFVRITVTR